MWAAVARLVGFLVTLFLGRGAARRAGAEEAVNEMKGADRAKADEIRDRADVVRRKPVSVRADDTRGYRD
jgi:hypothetical protein